MVCTARKAAGANKYTACIRREHAAHDVDECGLTRSVFPEQAQYLARMYLKVDAFENMVFSEGLAHTLQVHKRGDRFCIIHDSFFH